ncbi:MAG: aspartate kinase [Crocinitomicaceae bacterium]|jgi:aspartate kinase|nr:aspartate kinase [Crocinitomicaceae bacterium]
MLVFKFGGASVKDAPAVKNVAKILTLFASRKKLVVVSAMGKTTNLLEEIVKALKEKNEQKFDMLVDQCYDFHLEILNKLFTEKHYKVYQQLDTVFEKLRAKKEGFFSDNFHFEYDQVVSLGEILSTLIVEAYLRELGEKSVWIDSRKLIRTDHAYRDANVDWKKTEELIKAEIGPLTAHSDTFITQGFIGHTAEGFTTTLGREGSDYTAAIFAYCLKGESVTIWKDVPGMLNADPKWFDNTVKLDKISFKEAIELSYYGATVIHPKTIKPLQNKHIPLYVKSFLDPQAEGTTIQESMEYDHLVPSFIFKMQQVLFSITPKDFSFIVEENLSDIFEKLSRIGAKITLMQNSALSFSFALDQSKTDISEIYDLFKNDYEVRYNENLELVTIRHYNQETIERVMVNKEQILEQKTRQTIRILMKDKG